MLPLPRGYSAHAIIEITEKVSGMINYGMTKTVQKLR